MVSTAATATEFVLAERGVYKTRSGAEYGVYPWGWVRYSPSGRDVYYSHGGVLTMNGRLYLERDGEIVANSTRVLSFRPLK